MISTKSDPPRFNRDGETTEPAGPAPGLLVSPSWLQTHADDADLVILDCTAYLDDPLDPATGLSRARSQFLASHIPGARFVDLERELSDEKHAVRFMSPAPDQLSRVLQRLRIGAETSVVVYSRGEMWTATRVWWLLRLYGFDQCSVLDGGWALWNVEGRPTASGESLAPPVDPHAAWRSFVLRERSDLLANRHDVLANIGQKNVALINARQPPYFLGEAGNVYGRPGRIAGSVNVPAVAHLDTATQRFLSLDALRTQFDGLVQPDAQVIAYCGYGIAASGTVFALALLGQENVRLYDGSLAEWAADPGLPMATGSVDCTS
jgi:thiosulfate/3-mercaptopyruvate sulfurtransferase